MLNRLSDLVRLRTFANAQVQPVSRVNLDALSDLEAGDTVRAQVEAQLPDGTYRVAIRQQPFQLRLPFRAQVGDSLQLSVVTREPQIKFALAVQEDAPGLATNLSETARFVTALLDESEKFPHTETVRAGAPLLAAASGDSAEIAIALRNALAHSGIFYEAHQAQWIAGQRALAALMLEPQARYAPLRQSRQPAQCAQDGAGLDSAIVVLDDAPRLPELPVHRDALAVIKQQLDTLESRQVAWHGMIWQGQALDWEISEEPPAATQSGAPPAWRTRLRLTLPRMGRIDATILVAGRGVTITLRASNAGTLSMLSSHAPNLQLSLREAGIAPLGISVRRDESA